jgi:hexosaminidase
MVQANGNKKFQHSVVWNSDWAKMKCLPPQNFTIQVWLASKSQIKQFIDAKYNLIISHVDAWYLDCGFGAWRSPSGQGSCPPFKAWYTVYNYRPWNDYNLKLNHEQMKYILGGEACMWTEQVDENSVDTRIWPRSIALAERLWSDPNEPPSQKTINRFSIFHTRFLQLGLKADAIFPKYCEQNQEECFQ